MVISSCVYHDSHCNIQPWGHGLRTLLQCLGRLLLLLFFNFGTQFPGNEKLRYVIQKSTKMKLE